MPAPQARSSTCAASAKTSTAAGVHCRRQGPQGINRCPIHQQPCSDKREQRSAGECQKPWRPDKPRQQVLVMLLRKAFRGKLPDWSPPCTVGAKVADQKVTVPDIVPEGKLLLLCRHAACVLGLATHTCRAASFRPMHQAFTQMGTGGAPSPALCRRCAPTLPRHGVLLQGPALPAAPSATGRWGTMPCAC